jgi:methylenetetrahydrofolate dehydrogenase (NADP+)/methenyltetrahydrofolate cyclohydrolase
MAILLNGKKIAAKLQAQIKETLQEIKLSNLGMPRLAVILVGENPASLIYVSRKRKAAEEIGFFTELYQYPSHVLKEVLLEKIQELNNSDQVHGILLQLPLPLPLDSFEILSAISPLKDVDGLHFSNMGKLMIGRPHFSPCTPLGCLHLIKTWNQELHGKNVVVVGRSILVGRPLALMLLEEGCTVTIAHRQTDDLAHHCLQADILIAATGSPGLIRGSWVKPGACVIDVGITRIETKQGYQLVGDVVFKEVEPIASAITPVPGGVGPMTVAYLLSNVLKAYCLAHNLSPRPFCL